MPCRDDYPREILVEKLHDGVNAARLCAIMACLEGKEALTKVLDSVDWNEAGTSRSRLEKWWIDHKKIDADRRESERKELVRKKRAKSLANKPWKDLTQKERDLVQRYETKE